MVLFSAPPDLSGFDIHVSRLAQHTQGLLDSAACRPHDRRAGSGVTQPANDAPALDAGRGGDPGLRSPGYPGARDAYLRKFPNTALNFQLGDFLLVRIRVEGARLVTGFGKIFDLTGDDLKRLVLSDS